MSGITYTSFERDFIFEKRLGKGNFAIVNQVLHQIDKRSYAHKCIELSSTQQLSQAFNEIETIKCIDDQKIVRLMYYYVRQNKKTSKFELGMIMQLCHSNLAESIKIRKRKSDYFSKMDLREFLSAMLPFFAKMQRKGYLHRDIKPDNILLVKNANKKLQYKVGDFGFSIKMNAYSTQNIAGTMEYVSPKLLVKFKDNKIIVPGHNFKDDVYSFGKTLYQYMTLEVNEKFNEKKILDCSNRYGSQYWGLLCQMIKDKQEDRPDFIYLEAYAMQKELIESQTPQVNKQNFLSISTVNGAHSKKSLSPSKVKVKLENPANIKQNKMTDFTKTRKKDTDNEDNTTQAQNLTASRVNLRKSKIDEKGKVKITAYHEQVHCLIAYQNFVFVGSVGKLGVMIVPNDKIFKFKLQESTSPLTVFKIQPTRKYLIFGAMNNKIYLLQLSQMKKYITENYQLLKKKHEIEISIKFLKCKQYDSSLPVSTLDCYLDDKKQLSLIVGHFTGQITIIKGESKRTIISFSRMPITHLIYRSGFVYTSTGDGIFKRQSSISLGLWSYKQGENKFLKCLSQQRNNVYKYHELLICFELIQSCKYNEGIQKDQNKYLAIIISYDGLAHIISKAFKLEKLIRVTQNNITSASFSSAVNRQLGVQGRMVDIEGKIYSQSGVFVDKTDQKRISCISTTDNGILMGSYCKNLIQIKSELLIID